MRSFILKYSILGFIVSLVCFFLWFSESRATEYILPINYTFSDSCGLNSSSALPKVFNNSWWNQQGGTDFSIISKYVPATGTITSLFLNINQTFATVATSATDTKLSLILNNNSTTTIFSNLEWNVRQITYASTTLNIPITATDTRYSLYLNRNRSYTTYPCKVVQAEFVGYLVLTNTTTNTSMATSVMVTFATSSPISIANDQIAVLLYLGAFIIFVLGFYLIRKLV